MIDDKLLSRQSLDHDEWTITPKPEHLVPDSVERERTRESFRNDLEDDPATVVLTHIDADGYSSAALVADYCGPDTVVLPVSYHAAYDLRDALDDLARDITSNTTVYIVDLAANHVSIENHLAPAARNDIDVVWYDHHQWDRDTRAAVERFPNVTLVIDEDECAASLLARDLGQHYDGGGIPANFEPYLEELAEVTKDIDLWIRDDPRSERLNVFATIADVDEYIDTVLKHGVTWPDSVDKRIDERLERDRELEEAAIENRVEYGVGGYSVGITYVRGGRSSQIGNDLVEELDHDIAVILKPHGGMGIYSHSDRETFARCHEIADQLGGGGHPTAAGCEIPADSFRELADYWKTCGSSVRNDVLGAVLEVVGPDDQAGDLSPTLEEADVSTREIVDELEEADVSTREIVDELESDIDG